ncbi:MAG: DUF3870 domain-containing protein [Bacillota bacterium]|uniref:DUF3870 domain-containing protein n=1 Tax=Thermanaerosceptrum fracticalcis TaxID=1712410 RepID=A0A7G6E1M3_THEFR|nr:DUF3870 domain-containing protein [Thermanaerosceptrum fracticalcis]QNB45977.1 DUF3870 domain-containing protein [Thermanaerosceptrum fracticalcis]
MADTLFFSAQTKPAAGLTVEKLYGVLTIAMEIDPEDSRILDAECTFSTAVARTFFSKLVVQKNLLDDIQNILESIEKRYKGEVRKALVVGIKKIYRDYLAWRNAHPSVT